MFDSISRSETSEPTRPHRLRTVCVFGGAKGGSDPRLAEMAAALGHVIGAAGIRLVYGGGSDGLMGAVATAAARAGSDVVAVAPRFLMARMTMPAGIGQAIVVPDMHMRKRLMFDYADAFIALPGGIGTIEELAEVMTWRKLDQHDKPILIANFHDFWSPWLALLAHLETGGFLSGHVSSACLVAATPAEVLPLLHGGPSVVQDCSPRAGRAIAYEIYETWKRDHSPTFPFSRLREKVPDRADEGVG